jgi:putative conjugative transfer protein
LPGYFHVYILSAGAHVERMGKPSNSFLITGGKCMEFFNSAVTVLQTLVVALGAGLGIWGAINLLEGYGNDNPGAKSQGMKQLMAGGGVALIGITLVPLLSGLFG